MIRKTFINNKVIIEIDDFLSSEDCDQILEKRFNLFTKANSHYPQYYRNNNRIEEDNIELSHSLFKKLKEESIDELEPTVALNTKLRFCQYQTDQMFSKHQDGVFFLDDKKCSSLSFVLYLNEEFSGGRTLFFEERNDAKHKYMIRPQKGKLVVFDHTIWHSGEQVNEGEKYILRSDLLMEKTTISHHKGYIWCLCKVNDQQFFSGGRDGYVKLWDVNLSKIKEFNLHTKSVLSIQQIDTNFYISTSRDGSIKKWNISGNVTLTKNVKSIAICSAHSNDCFVTGNVNGSLIIYSKDLEVINEFSIHSSWVWGLMIVNNVIYSISEDGRLIRSTFYGESEELMKVDEGLFSVSLVKDKIACGSRSGKIYYYSLDNGGVSVKQVHKDIIRKIMFCNERTISVGEDNVMMIDGQSKIEHENFIQDVILMPGLLISAGFDGHLIKTDLG